MTSSCQHDEGPQPSEGNGVEIRTAETAEEVDEETTDGLQARLFRTHIGGFDLGFGLLERHPHAAAPRSTDYQVSTTRSAAPLCSTGFSRWTSIEGGTQPGRGYGKVPHAPSGGLGKRIRDGWSRGHLSAFPGTRRAERSALVWGV